MVTQIVIKMNFDTDKQGLETVFKWYIVKAYRYMWRHPEEGITTKQAHEIALQEGSISRASVIVGLAEAADMGLLTYQESPGKGGFRRIYYPAYTEEELYEWVARKLIDKLHRVAPDSKLITKLHREVG